MRKQILDLYQEYRRGALDRRDFFARLARIAGGAAAAAALLPLLENGAAEAQVVAPDDARLDAGYIKYRGASGEMRAYSARPKDAGKLSGVVVVHEIRGLNPHTEEVARRVALEGYATLAPDALSPLGGTPEDSGQVRTLMGQLDGEANTANYVAAVEYLKTQPQATGKVGCMGFCWGGGVTNQVAVHAPELTAAVPFYGRQPAAEDVPKIKAAMLIHYAGEDERINAGIPAFKETLEKAGVEHEIHTYEGAKHAFFNDTSPARYNKEAAQLAWQRTIAFFKKKLG